MNTDYEANYEGSEADMARAAEEWEVLRESRQGDSMTRNGLRSLILSFFVCLVFWALVVMIILKIF